MMLSRCAPYHLYQVQAQVLKTHEISEEVLYLVQDRDQGQALVLVVEEGLDLAPKDVTGVLDQGECYISKNGS